MWKRHFGMTFLLLSVQTYGARISHISRPKSAIPTDGSVSMDDCVYSAVLALKQTHLSRVEFPLVRKQTMIEAKNASIFSKHWRFT